MSIDCVRLIIGRVVSSVYADPFRSTAPGTITAPATTTDAAAAAATGCCGGHDHDHDDEHDSDRVKLFEAILQNHWFHARLKLMKALVHR